MKPHGTLTTGPLVRQTLFLGAPLALGMLAHGLFNLVDMLMVARLGPGAVASVTIGGIILPLGFLIFDGLSTATVERLSRALGAGKHDEAQSIAEESLRVAGLASLVCALVFGLGARPLVQFFAIDNADVVEDGVAYLAIMGYGMGGMIFILQTTAILRAVGSGRWPLYILVGANAANLVLTACCIYGLAGFPRLGVVGAALGTVAAQVIFAVLGVMLLVRGVHGLRVRPCKLIGAMPSLRSLLAQGLPTSLQLAARVVSVFLMLRIARDLTPGSAAAFMDGVGLCVRLEMMAVFMGLGFGAAATPFVAQNLGAGAVQRAGRGVWILAGAAAISMGLAAALMWWLHEPILRGLMPELRAESLDAARAYLAVLLPFLPGLGVGIVIARGLNGAGSTRTAMLVDLFLYLVLLLPLALLLPLSTLPRGPSAVWWCIGLVHALGAILYVVLWQRGQWKTRRR
ncbi:MAG: MATE family efflux transporter [Planctomycetes bacterium]|nr:MATE family efflux transporter [Planctomycetota bacterium]